MQAKTKKDGNGVLAVVGNLGEQSTKDLKSSVAHASTPELKSELARLLGFTAENLVRLAIITAELEKRGEDLSELKIGLLPLLRQIALGKLHPQIVVMFAGEPMMLRDIGKLPLFQQQEIVDGTRSAIAKRIVNDDDPIRSQGQGTRHVVEKETIKDSPACNAPNLRSIAANSHAKDVADMAAELIVNHKYPDVVFKELLMALRAKMDKKSARAISAAFVVLAGP